MCRVQSAVEVLFFGDDCRGVAFWGRPSAGLFGAWVLLLRATRQRVCARGQGIAAWSESTALLPAPV